MKILSGFVGSKDVSTGLGYGLLRCYVTEL